MAKTKITSATTPIEKFELKKFSWILILVLGTGLFYALTLLPLKNGPQPTFHVASRYIERGLQETGISDPIIAVWSDYRSFDVILLSFIFLIWTLIMFLLGPIEEMLARAGWFALVFISVFGVFALLIVGILCLKNGGNYLDYDFLANFFSPPLTRRFGALFVVWTDWMTLCALLIFYSKIFIAWRKKRHDK